MMVVMLGKYFEGASKHSLRFLVKFSCNFGRRYVVCLMKEVGWWFSYDLSVRSFA